MEMDQIREKPRPRSLEDAAASKPGIEALVDDQRSLSWSDWNRLSDNLAEGLHELGLRENDIVAVSTHIRCEFGIIDGALSKLGCALLGLNGRLTVEDVQFIIQDSGAVALIHDHQDPVFLEQVADGLDLKARVSVDTPVEGWTSFDELIAADGPERMSRKPARLIIYTSGTTGRPKGVASRPDVDPRIMEEYRGSVDHGNDHGDQEVVLITMPFSHMAAPSQLRRAIAAQHKTVMLRKYDAETVLRLIDGHKVTKWVAVPTMIKRLAALPRAVVGTYDTTSMRSLGVGAAPVTVEQKQWIMSQFGEILTEGYGSTESSMITHMPASMQREKPGSCGKPLRHVVVEIRDEDNNVLGPGKTGEIWVKTPALFAGYLNQPPLDRSVLDEKGLFRMGDVGHLDADGYLYITDRAKDMIVSGGVNLYPAEIEEALQRHEGILDVAVIGIPHEDFGEQVMAFVEPIPGHALSEDDVFSFAEEALASYKRPKQVTIVDELPKNPMGKTLKRQLREPFWQGRDRKV